MKTKLNAIAFKAQTHPRHRFHNLYGLLDAEMLEGSWGKLNKQSAPGLDGVTPREYQQSLSENIERLGNRTSWPIAMVTERRKVRIKRSTACS